MMSKSALNRILNKGRRCTPLKAQYYWETDRKQVP